MDAFALPAACTAGSATSPAAVVCPRPATPPSARWRLRSTRDCAPWAHDGEAAYRDQLELVHRRSATEPNEQWAPDHTLLDLQVLDAQQKPARPWLTVVLDDHSRR